MLLSGDCQEWSSGTVRFCLVETVRSGQVGPSGVALWRLSGVVWWDCQILPSGDCQEVSSGTVRCCLVVTVRSGIKKIVKYGQVGTICI